MTQPTDLQLIKQKLKEIGDRNEVVLSHGDMECSENMAYVEVNYGVSPDIAFLISALDAAVGGLKNLSSEEWLFVIKNIKDDGTKEYEAKAVREIISHAAGTITKIKNALEARE